MKTVSRVLNGEPHVRPALRERVQAAIDALAYQPQLAARQLAGAKSFVLSLLIPEHSLSFYTALVIAAARECRRQGYHLVSETLPDDEPFAVAVSHITSRLRPDGIILPPPLSDDAELIASIAARKIPLALLSSRMEGHGIVINAPQFDVSLKLMHHLLDLGHRRIGLIAPPPDHSAVQARQTAYEQALRDRGLPLDPQLVVQGNFSFASGAVAARTLLTRADRPTAIFATNDGMALGALAAAAEAGLAVPDDLAIAGFDDSPGSRMSYPALTTVRQPLEQLARAAVLALLGKAMPAAPFEHELIVRASTTGDERIILDALDA